jgi:ParB-like chromosome segregation protein Spo0J
VNLAEKLVMRPIGALVPYASNSRTHTPDQISKIARSIKSFGFTIRSSSTARTAL